MEYLDPENNQRKGVHGFNVDFIYNYELFDFEEYGNESIKTFSGIISHKIFLGIGSTNYFSFEIQTTQLND